MKKYFAVSDIHSFYTVLRKSLKKAGFEIRNPEHILIVCGDIFDRGDETFEVYKFLKRLQKKNRAILIRGNHEYLLRECIHKGKFQSYDYSNGTASSINQLFEKIDLEKNANKFYKIFKQDIDIIKHSTYYRVQAVNEHYKLIDWIFNSDAWVNYFELGQYIFVHSFVPVDPNPKEDNWYAYAPIYNTNGAYSIPCEKWRDLPKGDIRWDDATWGCPYIMLSKYKLFKEKGKTLVVGHWHSSDFHRYYRDGKEYNITYVNTEFNGKIPFKEENNTSFYGDKIISLDACIARHEEFCNVLVLDENGKVLNHTESPWKCKAPPEIVTVSLSDKN